ncbi:(deoxy)nucleoside triphosphate pyrophosphohydrolase [uncultured Selenomonas sp.]|uniref:(deoxy)nucleoside triphosphate pyrophosphohydrolase n=1 Tax=uncultured Selenomonas sp. TaxID=159275 RepID=UPI0028D38B2A|nr:(deoxy)nucleoside triphosphate pyrophosphohydrolase [uncultured Selenomonas sp.]
MEKRKHIDVVAGAILRDGKVFGACRGYGAYAGTWEFAGGKVETGESDEAALMREIREELGIEIALVRLLGIVDHDYPEYHMNMRLYVCRHVEGEPQLRVHSEGRWLGRSDLYTVPWFEADMELIRMLEAELC